MKGGTLWRISVLTTLEAEDAVSLLLEEALGQRAFSYTDFETGATSVTVYLPRKPPLPGPQISRMPSCAISFSRA